MKLKNILRNVTAMALPLALLGSCTGDFEELNTNPYEIDPEELPFEAQFSTPLSFSYPTHQNLFQYWTSLSIDNYGGYFEVPHSNWTITTSPAGSAAACTRTSCRKYSTTPAG